MKSLKFTKMQGLGNDFVVLDSLLDRVPNDLSEGLSASYEITHSDAVKICDRRFGIGADQILWLRKPHLASNDVRMEILNADGSVAEMCGNGIRAVALYLNHHLFRNKTEFKVETLAGTKIVQVNGKSVLVDMGVPVLGAGAKLGGESISVVSPNESGKSQFSFFEVNVGNPHAVCFVDEVSSFPVEKWGPLIEKHPRFPNRTNVEFVERKSANSIQVRVWERGAGTTLACGTGACAAAVASLTTGKLQNPVEVQLPGGNLIITWAGPGSSVMMEGPAEEVFSGTVNL